MNYHINEYKQCGVEGIWLDAGKAKNVYDFALKYSSKNHYGLDKNTVSNICLFNIVNEPIAKRWLIEQFPGHGTVEIIHGETAVCLLQTETFLAHWFNLFMPSRDDVLILHNESNYIAFYCHEDFIEVGQRIPI